MRYASPLPCKNKKKKKKKKKKIHVVQLIVCIWTITKFHWALETFSILSPDQRNRAIITTQVYFQQALYYKQNKTYTP